MVPFVSPAPARLTEAAVAPIVVRAPVKLRRADVSETGPVLRAPNAAPLDEIATVPPK